MKLLEGKKALIFGIANKNSIAYGIAQTFHEHGAALGFSYGIPKLERRVAPLAEGLGVEFVELCDVTKDEDITRLFVEASNHFGKIDILVHSVAFAGRDHIMAAYAAAVRERYRFFSYGDAMFLFKGSDSLKPREQPAQGV